MNSDNYSVLVLAGKQGAGKTTLSQGLNERLHAAGVNVVFMKFAAPLYRFHDLIRIELEKDDMDDLEEIDGPLLQVLGTEWGRKTRGEDFWIRYAHRAVKRAMQEFVENGVAARHTVFIFDDCRFPNELQAFPGSLSIRLEASEEMRRERADKWRPNTSHISEVALDQAPFDLIIETETASKEQTLETAMKYVSVHLLKRIAKVSHE